MADELSEGIENALNIIVNTTERSGNMKKELKQTIFETVSTLGNLFVQLKGNRDSKSNAFSELELRITKMKAELEESRCKTLKVQGAPSVILSLEPTGMVLKGAAPSGYSEGKLYSEALGDEKTLKRFKLTVKSEENQTPDAIKGLLKSKINPTEITVGINFFKPLKNGKVVIETSSKEETEALEKDISAKYGGTLEVNIHKLRNPRLVTINIPEDITVGNIEDTLIAQNPNLNLKKGTSKLNSAMKLRNIFGSWSWK
jgi:hypothetical protein